jgi:hypothetical protein
VSAPVAPPPKVPTLADDVETEGASAGGRRLPLGTGENSGPGERFVFLVPKGWTEERLVTDGTVWQGLAHPRHPKGDAKVVINSFSWRPEQPTLDAWTKFLRVADAAWEAPHDGKLGALPARIAAGKGKLGGEDADLVYALISQRGGYILAIGALKNGATPERRQELVDCLRGLALR